jgi:hypothetical protein
MECEEAPTHAAKAHHDARKDAALHAISLPRLAFLVKTPEHDLLARHPEYA